MSSKELVWYKDQPAYFIINKSIEPIMTQTHPKEILHELTDDLASTESYYYRKIDMEKIGGMNDLVKDHEDNKAGKFDPIERGYIELNTRKR